MNSEGEGGLAGYLSVCDTRPVGRAGRRLDHEVAHDAKPLAAASGREPPRPTIKKPKDKPRQAPQGPAGALDVGHGQSN